MKSILATSYCIFRNIESRALGRDSYGYFYLSGRYRQFYYTQSSIQEMELLCSSITAIIIKIDHANILKINDLI